MKININSVHASLSDSYKAHLREKLNKFEEKYDWIIRGEIFLKQDHDNHNRDKVIEIQLSVPGENIFAERKATTWAIAEKKVFEAVRHQLKKHKEKDFSHAKHSPIKQEIESGLLNDSETDFIE